MPDIENKSLILYCCRPRPGGPGRESGPVGVGRGRSGLVGEQERAQFRTGCERRKVRCSQNIENSCTSIENQ